MLGVSARPGERCTGERTIGPFGPDPRSDWDVVPSGGKNAAMRIALGSDHAGFDLKAHLIDHLTAQGHEVLDLGTDSTESVDYPEFCAAVGRAVVASYALLLLPAGVVGLAVASRLGPETLRGAIGGFVLVATWAPGLLRMPGAAGGERRGGGSRCA